MGAPRNPGEIAQTMRTKGMNTAQIIKALNMKRELAKDISKEVEALIDRYTAVDAKAANANFRLMTDPTITNLNKLEQHAQGIIKLVAENKATTTIGTQLQGELAQLPQSVSYAVNQDKIKKDVAELVTKLNATITDIMTKLQSGSLSQDEIRQGLDSFKDVSKKVKIAHEQIDKVFSTETDALNKFASLAKRAKEIVDSTPALASGMSNVPKYDGHEG